MATPTPVVYSVPHGATCYGGKRGPVSLPAWAQNAPLNQWYSAGVVDMKGSQLDNYCGWAFARGRFLVVPAGSGHAVSDNRAVKLDVLADQLVGALMTNPSGGLDGSPSALNQIPPSTTSSPPYYYDGRPAGRHLRHNPQYFKLPDGTDGVFMIGCRDVYGDGPPSWPTMDRIDLDTHLWDPKDTWPNIPGPGSSQVNGSAFVDVNGDPWSSNGQHRFDRATRQWVANASTQPNNPVRYPWMPSIRRGMVLGVNVGNGFIGNGDPSVYIVKMVNGVQTVCTFDASSASAVAQLGAENGVEAGGSYDEINDYWLFYSGANANTVYKITQVSSTVFHMEVLTTGGTQLPLAQGCIQSRFTYVPALKGFVTMPSLATGLFYMRTA